MQEIERESQVEENHSHEHRSQVAERLLETSVSTCSVSNTSVLLLQVADGKSEVSRLMDLRWMVKRPRALGPRELVTTARLNTW